MTAADAARFRRRAPDSGRWTAAALSGNTQGVNRRSSSY